MLEQNSFGFKYHSINKYGGMRQGSFLLLCLQHPGRRSSTLFALLHPFLFCPSLQLTFSIMSVQSSDFLFSIAVIVIPFLLPLRCFVLSDLSSEVCNSVSKTTLLYEALCSTLLVFLDLEPAGNEHLTRRRS